MGCCIENKYVCSLISILINIFQANYSMKNQNTIHYFKINAPWAGALVLGVSISALSLLGIFIKLGPLSREAETEWLCNKWKGANPEPGTKWEKAKAYKKLKKFTGSYDAFRFCK